MSSFVDVRAKVQAGEPLTFDDGVLLSKRPRWLSDQPFLYTT